MSESAAGPAVTGRRSGRALALYAGGQLLVALVGVGILSTEVDHPDAYAVVFGVFLLGLALVSLLATVLEALHARGTRGAVTGTAPDGSAATVLARASWVPPVSAGFLLVIGGSLGAGGLVAVFRGDLILAVALLVPSAFFLMLLVPVLSGRVTSGGVYLTAHGVTSVKDGTWWRVAWDEIAGVVPGEPLAVLLREGARPESGRSAPAVWRSEVRAPDGVLAVQTRYLSEDTRTLAFLLLAYRDRPDLREQLGTSAALDWEILRAGS